jgi:hypothetical protein
MRCAPTEATRVLTLDEIARLFRAIGMTTRSPSSLIALDCGSRTST